MNRDFHDGDAVLGELLLDHQGALKATIGWTIRDHWVAEEALSDAMFAIFQAWSKFKPGCDFKPWACGIARNVALGKLRELRRKPPMIEFTDVIDIAEEMDVVTNEEDRRKQILRGCLRRLRARHQRLLKVFHVQNQTYAALAAELGRSVGSLHVAIHRLHTVLRQCIRKQIEKA